MGRAPSALLVCVLALTGARGCAAFGADEDPASDGGADGAAAPDGPAPTPDGAPPDGGIRPCVSPFTFCDDFERDDPRAVSHGWRLGPATATQAQLTISSAHFTSPSRSLQIVIPGGTDNTNGRGYLDRDLPPNARVFAMAFSVRMDATAPKLQLASLSFDDGKYVLLDVEGGALKLVEQEIIGGQTSNAVITVGRLDGAVWARFEIGVDLDAKKLTLKRDGVPAGAADLQKTYMIARQARLGVTYTEGRAPACTLWFDDVALFAQ
jgi:hypothetical protein